MSRPVAYLLTWNCYGAWLHGDERGSVDGSHDVIGADRCPTDLKRATAERRALVSQPMTLDATGRGIVEAAIRDHCRVRGWELVAVNVRSNHVHALVAAEETAPETVMGQFKAWGTRRLRDAGIVAGDAAVWARHGSTRYMWDEKSVAAAAVYVEEAQDGAR